MESDRGSHLDERKRKITFDKRPMVELSMRGEEQCRRGNSNIRGPEAGESFVCSRPE